MQEVSRRVKALGEELSGAQAELEEALASLPNPPDPTAADEDTTLREVGEAGATGRDHLELAGDAIDMEAGARIAGSRFAVLKGDMVLLELALVRWAMEVLGGHGFEPVIPPVLVREEALFGTGFLPDTEQQIYRLADDALYLTGTSEVAARLAARGRDARRGGAAAALRGLLALLPARGRRRGARHARHVPRAPVRQGRDVLVRAARGREGRARAAAGDRGGAAAGARGPVPRGQHRGRRPRRPAPRRSTTARRGCPASSATARSPRPPTRPTSRPAGSTSATGPRRRQARVRPHAQRHRGDVART